MIKLSLSLALVLFVASPAAAEPDAEPPPESTWSLEVDAKGCVAGDHVPYRLAWTNHGDKPLRVPADLLKRPRAYGQRRTAESGRPAVYLTGIVVEAPPAGKEGVVVPPGQSLQRIGVLADFFGDCKDGCPAGAYKLQLRADDRTLLAGLEPDDDGPPVATLPTIDLLWEAVIPAEQPAPTIPVSVGPGLEATLTRIDGTGKTKTATLRLTVHNGLGHPIYFPPKEAVTAQWAGHATRGTALSGWRRTTGGQHRAAWGPDSAVIVAPGATWQLDLVVPDLDKRMDHVWVKLDAAPTGAFQTTTTAKTPFHFDGFVRALEVQVF